MKDSLRYGTVLLYLVGCCSQRSHSLTSIFGLAARGVTTPHLLYPTHPHPASCIISRESNSKSLSRRFSYCPLSVVKIDEVLLLPYYMICSSNQIKFIYIDTIAPSLLIMTYRVEEPERELSEYEKKRLEHIRKNKEHLKRLGLDKLVQGHHDEETEIVMHAYQQQV